MFPSPSACPPKVRLAFGSYQKCFHVHYSIPVTDSRGRCIESLFFEDKSPTHPLDRSRIRNINCSLCVQLWQEWHRVHFKSLSLHRHGFLHHKIRIIDRLLGPCFKMGEKESEQPDEPPLLQAGAALCFPQRKGFTVNCPCPRALDPTAPQRQALATMCRESNE